MKIKKRIDKRESRLSEYSDKEWLNALIGIVERETTRDFLKFWKQKKTETKPLFNYRMEHVKAVAKLVMRIADKTKADTDVLLAAAWLHDIGKKMAPEKSKPESSANHAEVGTQHARKILSSKKLRTAGFPQEKIDSVCHAIGSHEGLSLKKPLRDMESAILWDADKLAKLGATFIVHSLPTMPVYGQLILNEYTDTEKIRQRGVEWLKLGAEIVSSFNTPYARKIGRKRLGFLELFYSQLDREWSGDE